MTKPSWFSPAQMQALNPALVMLIIPFNNFVVYPWLRRRGKEPSQWDAWRSAWRWRARPGSPWERCSS
jgi:hypothetical protein